MDCIEKVPKASTMFGSIATSGETDATNQYVSYSSSANCSQSNFIASFLTDFETDYCNFSFDSDNFLESSDSSPPPTPDIISSFSVFAADSPASPTTPIYQNLSSPKYPLQSPSSSSSSMSIASPPNTILETRNRLIKDSLRLTIQSRRTALGLEELASNQMSPNGYSESDATLSPDFPLTVADEDRRRRRRERNKVAATKCRNKKKLHSVQLVQESESLEMNNAQMRKEISDLREESEQLSNLLNSHQSVCKLTINFNNYNTYVNYSDNNNNNGNLNLNASSYQIFC